MKFIVKKKRKKEKKMIKNIIKYSQTKLGFFT